MNTEDIIKDSLYDSMKTILTDLGHRNTKVIFDNENGLEPKNTYCLISILSRERQGRQHESTHLTQESEMWRTEIFKLYVQISFIGKSSANVGWNFDDSFPASRTYIQEFQKRCLGFIRKGKLLRSPQPRETNWVDSWVVDLELSFAIQSRQTMEWIEYFTMDGEVYRVYYPELEDRTVDTGEERETSDGRIRQFIPS